MLLLNEEAICRAIDQRALDQMVWRRWVERYSEPESVGWYGILSFDNLLVGEIGEVKNFTIVTKSVV
jgi:hypothetical protein